MAGKERKGKAKRLHLSTSRKSMKKRGKNLLAYIKAKKEGTWIPRDQRPLTVGEPGPAGTQEFGVTSGDQPSSTGESLPPIATAVDGGPTGNAASCEEPDEESMDEESTAGEEFVLEGRRIVDVAYFLRALQEASGKHEPLECSFADMKVTAEVHLGFISSLRLECDYCDTVARITTEDPARPETENINTVSVPGVVNVLGANFQQLQALMGAMQVKCMGSRQWRKQLKELWKNGHDTLMEEMLEAGREERQLAREAGRVGVDGIAIIPVVTDAAWSNRFYRLKIGMTNSTTGVSAILGYHTRRLLYIGVLHKYCTVCAMYARERAHQAAAPAHKCARKWTNVASLLDHASVGEGFKLSVAMHQLKYGQLVGDTDGSVRRMLLETQPYGAEFLVSPVESISDLLRGYTSTLSRLSTDVNGAIKPLRNMLRKSLRRLRVGVISAVKRRKVQKTPTVMNVQQLHDDIVNVPAHVFGDHRYCAALLCEDKGGKLPVLEVLQSALFAEVQLAARILAQQAPKLILDVECNIAEKYNAFLVEVLFTSRVLAPGAMERVKESKAKDKDKEPDENVEDIDNGVDKE